MEDTQLTVMIIKAMKSYRVQTPADKPKRPGQTPLKDHFAFKQGSQELKLPWGAVVEAREHCEYPFEFSKNEQKYLAHIDFIKSHKNLFNPL